jgi:hypothetical protein
VCAVCLVNGVHNVGDGIMKKNCKRFSVRARAYSERIDRVANELRMQSRQGKAYAKIRDVRDLSIIPRRRWRNLAIQMIQEGKA